MSYKSFWQKTATEKLAHMWSYAFTATSDYDHCTPEQCVEILTMLAAVDYAVIAKHDADDETHKHWHAVVWLKNRVRNSTVLKLFKDYTHNDNAVMTSYYHSLPAAVVYLCHRTADCDDKHEYDPATLIGLHCDAQQLYAEYEKEYKNPSHTMSLREAGTSKRERVAAYAEMISNGTLRPYNIPKYVSDIDYSTDADDIKRLWEYHLKKEALHPEYEKGPRIIWTWGDAGVGKTGLASYCCYKKGVVPYITSSGTDILGKYEGQEVIIIDDLRPEHMTPEDLLKLIDPRVRSNTRSRYYDKLSLAKVIYITTPYSPTDWWVCHRSANTTAGPWEQLLRRLTGGSIRVTRGSWTRTMYDTQGHAVSTVKVDTPQDFKDWCARVTQYEEDPLADIFATGTEMPSTGSKRTQTVESVSTAEAVSTGLIDASDAAMFDEVPFPDIEDMVDHNEFFAYPYPDGYRDIN